MGRDDGNVWYFFGRVDDPAVETVEVSLRSEEWNETTRTPSYREIRRLTTEDFLEKEGCEFMVPGVLPFFFYMFDNRINAKNLYGEKKGVSVSLLGMKFAKHIEKVMDKVLDEYPMFKKPSTFSHEKELVDPILNRGVVMGEGWLLPAEVAELIELGYNNVICVQPFGCLPNHIVGKGTIRVLREKYKDANIFPIDYDSSASTVNQENRIKLMLSMAREKELNETTGN